MSTENNKPIQIMMDEFKKNIANTINNSGLPIYIVTPILKDILNEAVTLEQSEYIRIKKEYEKQDVEVQLTKDES